MKNYVIIGNGVAAAGCIEGIKSVDEKSKITVISSEKHPVYCRPLISYYLEGKTTVEKMSYRPADFYEKNGCDCVYGHHAEKIDAEKGLVVLSDGTAIPYDSVCVAAGSSPLIPQFSGLETVKNKFSFMTLDDTLALEAALSPDARVLIVGAGLIGLKCAEGLRGRVGAITVCDLSDRVLSSILEDECAHIVQKHLESHGIKFMLGDTVDVFDKNRAVMKSGTAVDFDILVLAVGVRPNTSLVRDAGGKADRGIIVDKKMQTSTKSIYAAGDCTEGDDISSGTKKVLALLPNAYMQGHCAGVNMAGGDEAFDTAIPMNSIGFFGLHLMTAGTYYTKADGGGMYEEKTEAGLKKLYLKDGRLCGFIIVGDTARAGIYTSLIRERTPLDTLDVELLKKSPSLAVFSPEICRKKLGGVL